MATKKRNGNGATLTISGLEVAVTHERVLLDELSLDFNNPRIRLQIKHGGKKKPSTQQHLQALIRDQPGYDDLQKQIRKLGGIYDPIIVRHDGTVVEGNTRLAALQFLHATDKNDARWKSIPITRLPANIPENVVEMLMANFHIAGKTMWRPAAQADQIYRLVRELDVPVQQVADETRMTVLEVERYLAAYEYLVKEVLPEATNGDGSDWQQILESKFHHALELMKGKKLKHIRDDPVARKDVAKLIAQNKITGQQVRKLPEVIGNRSTADVLKAGGFNAANEARKKADPTADSRVIKAMRTTSELLRAMTPKEIDMFRNDETAKEVLLSLVDAVNDVVTLSTKKVKGARHG